MTKNPYFLWTVFMAVYLLWMNLGLLFVAFHGRKIKHGKLITRLALFAVFYLDAWAVWGIAMILG